MSGICGWSHHANEYPVNRETLAEMLATMRFGGDLAPLEIYQSSSALATLGRRDSDHGAAEWKGLRAVFQGRIRWRDSTIRDVAGQFGDARAILEAYTRLGPAFLEQMSGPFALSLVDDTQRRTLLATDRLGIQALFYSIQGNTLIFASNARAITRHPDANDKLSPQALFDYLYFHMVPGPRGVYTDQCKLLPGQYLLVEDSDARTDFYWQPHYTESDERSQVQLKREFLEKLEGAVAEAARDGKVGAFLSGGTDSSTVSGLLRKTAGVSVDTYSIGFEAEGFDETEYARIASRHFDTRPHEYYLKPQDVVETIPLIAAAYDEPFGNASAVPAYFCAKLARADGLDTLLAGDGGDELFAGNARYAKQKIFDYYLHIPEGLRRSIMEPLVFSKHLEALPLAGKARSYIEQANTPLPDRLEAYNFLNRFPLEEIFTGDFLANINRHKPMEYLRETYQRAHAETSLNRMLFVDLKFTLADNDLRKVNRMCELGGIEARFPLLDDDLVDFSTRLPSSLKLRGQHLRYFFKQALKDLLPLEIVHKSKHGFGLPFGLWMGTYQPLEEITRDSLEKLGRRGYIQPAFIERLLLLQKQHPSYYGVMIWVLMMLEQWLQKR